MDKPSRDQTCQGEEVQQSSRVSRSIDVVIPAFNPEPWQLDRAIESAMAINGVGQVILVDDGSHPPVSVDPKHTESQKVKVVRQGNKGPSAARNRGIELSKSKWLLFLDADDEVAPTGVQEAINLANSKNARIIIASRWEVAEDGSSELRSAPSEWLNSLLESRAHVFRPIELFSTTGIIVHQDITLKGLRFDENIVYGEDRDFLYRAAADCRIAVSESPIVYQRVFRNGSNLRSPNKIGNWIRDHMLILNKHLPSSAVNDVGDLDSMIKKRWLRKQTLWLANAASKVGLDVMTWHALKAAAKRQGWELPLKCKIRVWWMASKRRFAVAGKLSKNLKHRFQDSGRTKI